MRDGEQAVQTPRSQPEEGGGSGVTHPGHGEVRHELLEGPGLLRLLLVVQRDLLAELPGVGAPCARGARHAALLKRGATRRK